MLPSHLSYVKLLPCLLVAVVVFLPGRATGGDAFTGFEIDDEIQYYAYLGVKAPVSFWKPAGLQPFLRLFAATQRYKFRADSELRDARVHDITPSVGLQHQIQNWTLAASVGPEFREKHEEGPNGAGTTRDDVGVTAQGEAFYWSPSQIYSGIVSYGNLDHFVWGRVRAKFLTHEPVARSPLYLGWDIVAMGNSDFSAFQTGPLFEVPIKKVFFLIKGGYKYTSTFHNGAYTGFEVYLPF